MENLIQKIAPIILIGAGLVGCATYQPKPVEQQKEPEVVPVASMGIDLKNGYHAESYSVIDLLDLLTCFQTGEVEVTINQVGMDYRIDEKKQTALYDLTPPDRWDDKYNNICESIDNGDKFISEIEVQKYINSLFQVQWVEGDDTQ